VANSNGKSSSGGCWALIALVIVVGAIVAAAISLAAIVDPFDWMPSARQIWAHCEGDCALAHRFPGFWWHVVANLVYAAVVTVAAIVFAAAIPQLRATRARRFASAAALEEYRHAHHDCVRAGAGLAALATLALVIAIA
jgi:uncharacterized membrane protein YhaH (DUF805 family)